MRAARPRRSSPATVPAPSGARRAAGRPSATARRTRPTWAPSTRPLTLALFYCDEGRWDDAAELIAYAQDDATELIAAKLFPATVRRKPDCDRPARRRGTARGPPRPARRGTSDRRPSSHRDGTIAQPEQEGTLLVGLAEVWRAAGERADADAAVASTLELYEQKGNVAAAASLRATAARDHLN